MAEEKTVTVEGEAAYQIRLLQFDKKIAELKLSVADLERQKIDFIYNAIVESALKGKGGGKDEKESPDN